MEAVGTSRTFISATLCPAAKATGNGYEASLRRLLKETERVSPAARAGGLCISSPWL